MSLNLFAITIDRGVSTTKGSNYATSPLKGLHINSTIDESSLNDENPLSYILDELMNGYDKRVRPNFSPSETGDFFENDFLKCNPRKMVILTIKQVLENLCSYRELNIFIGTKSALKNPCPLSSSLTYYQQSF